MIIELDRKGLEMLIKGNSIGYEYFDHTLVKKAGHRYSDCYGKTEWNDLKNLTEEELYVLYLMCRENLN